MVNIGANGNRAEADRWLVTSEKLLASNDLHGAKTFAIRACESDPTRAAAADYILAICDILIAGSLRLSDSNLPDWYSVLRLGQLTQNPEHVATQYRRLALLLNPSVNRLPFADKAFSLVSDAWRVLSDPSRKSAYDRELQLSQLGGPSRRLGGSDSDPNETSFWTACPYCFVLFEYAKGYEECVLKCQDCKRAFQAVRIQKPPAVIEGEGEDVYFCSWSVFPLGFSGEFQPPPRRRTSWSPISPLFACPKKRKEPDSPRIFYDDDDVYVAISDEEDDEEVQVNKKGKEKEAVVRRGVGSSSSDVMCRPVSGSSSRKGMGSSGAKNVGRLDLNEEPGVAGGRREGSGVGSSREVDNIIEGIGFFEGLDEFLMSMPILSVVGDDKIKAT